MANPYPNDPHQASKPPTYRPPSITPTQPQPYAETRQQQTQVPHNPVQQQPLQQTPPRAFMDTPNDSQSPQAVAVPRPMIPDEPEMHPEAMRRHKESKEKFPYLNLSKGEFVISAVRRHPIGLISIWGVGVLIVLLSIGLFAFISTNKGFIESIFGDSAQQLTSMAILSLPLLLLCGLVLIGTLIATYVYVQNRFFLTNESVMQFIQVSLFSRKEQTISLVNIEDASYRQHGLLQHIFNYGNIRLSTQGEETTYRFSFVANPRKQIALLNDAVEAFKNGRPIGMD